MPEAEFIPAGSDINQANLFACKLITEILLNEKKFPLINQIDVRSLSAIEAENLDHLLWSAPEDVIIPHNLIHEKDDHSFINIGYPGGKFIKGENKILVNLNPDLPDEIEDYQFLYQLVIEDGDMLRERAANSWKKCKKLGLKTHFKKAL